MTAKRFRVVVTGMGVVSPLGSAASAFIDALVEGRSGVGPITIFDTATLPTRIAGEGALPAEVPLGDRKIAFALEAARQAIAQSGLSSAPDREAGVSLGVGLELFNMDHLVARRRPGFELPGPLPDRLAFMQTASDLSVHLLAHRFGFVAPPLVHVSACAAGTDGIGAAYRMVATGRRRRMLAGGSDSMINPLGVAGFCTLNATSVRNDVPAGASRPFDRTRDGFVMGEGAGVLVLERAEDAAARGVQVLAEIAGYGTSFDAFKISDPHPEGRGAHLAMARALEDAGIGPDAVDAVNAHGTGTPKNDPAETLALKKLLGDRAKRVPVSATKSMIGHLISGAGAVEAVAVIGTMLRSVVHPTINLNDPDPECDLDYVPHVARDHQQEYVLSSSYGFGGHNSAIVVRHPRNVSGVSA